MIAKVTVVLNSIVVDTVTPKEKNSSPGDAFEVMKIEFSPVESMSEKYRFGIEKFPWMDELLTTKGILGREMTLYFALKGAMCYPKLMKPAVYQELQDALNKCKQEAGLKTITTRVLHMEVTNADC